MTEEEVLLRMEEAGNTASLAFDATIWKYLICGYGLVEESIVDRLLKQGLITEDDLIHNGSVQLYKLTEKYEKRI